MDTTTHTIRPPDSLGELPGLIPEHVCEGLSATFHYELNQGVSAEPQARPELLSTVVLDAIRAGVIVIDAATHRIVDVNACALELLGADREAVLGTVCHRHVCQAECGRCPITDLKQTVDLSERILLTARGDKIPVLKSVVSIESQGRTFLVESFVDLSDRKRTEAKLAAVNDRLVEASRQAGMAELATGVLHNVGNILNSVNVSTTLLTDLLRRSKIVNFVAAAELLRTHADQLASFLTEDQKGLRLPGYLCRLADHLAQEQAVALAELEQLAKSVEHIKKIVSMQQANARAFGVVESVCLAEVVDDALTVNATSFERYGIHLVREYGEFPPIVIDRHKLLQVLVNLVRNAKHAVLDSGQSDKRLTFRIAPNGSDQVRITVIDNGVGIPKEHLTRIFAHGFTTKRDGHGFGLHSSALAAKDMGGSLTAESDGLGQGATFTLIVPIRPATTAAGASLIVPAASSILGATP